MNKMKIISIIIAIVLGIGLIVYCVSATVLDPTTKVGYVGNSFGNKIDGSFRYFNGTEGKDVKFNKGDKVTIDYRIELENGELSLVVKDKAGTEIINKSDNTGEVTFEVSETQEYSINAVAQKAKGKYEIKWSTK